MSTNGVNNSGSSSMMIWQSEAALAAELGGDVNAQVAAMMLKHGHDKRANAREMRHSEEDRLRSFEGQQVAKLREQAKHVLEAATRAAYGKIASGGLQVAYQYDLDRPLETLAEGTLLLSLIHISEPTRPY